MNELLQQVESYLTSLIEGNVIKIFGTIDAEKELIRQLITEMDDNSSVDEQQTCAPPFPVFRMFSET